MTEPTDRTETTSPSTARRRSPARAVAAGAALGIASVVGIGVGVSSLADAQEDPSPAESSDDTGLVERDTGARLGEVLAPLVDDGTLTQDQADAVVQRLLDARPERLHDRPFLAHRGQGADAVADLLGLTTEELRTALGDGRTLAELAAENGVSTDELASAMLAGVEEHLSERVAAGDLTQDQADERLAAATERATAVIDGEGPPRFGARRGPGERWGA